MRRTFSISFTCRPSKANRKGEAAVEAILSANQTRTYITLPRRERPEEFARLMACKRSNDLQEFCNTVRERLNNAVTALLADRKAITADAVKNFLTEEEKSRNVSNLLKEYLAVRELDVDAGRLSLPNYRKYELVMDVFTGMFGDKPVDAVTVADMRAYAAEVQKRFMSATAKGYFTRLTAIFNHARELGWIDSNPAAFVSVRREKPKMEYLTDSELQRLRTTPMPNVCLERVRDAFLFMCCTGLAYCDFATLEKKDVCESQYGYYVSKCRHKTDIAYTVLLCDEALELLDKYDWQLPVISNQKQNMFLKSIAIICGIEKNLHCHLARHTYATMLINKGVPMEFVSKALGHSSIRVTESTYAFIKKGTILSALSTVKR